MKYLCQNAVLDLIQARNLLNTGRNIITFASLVSVLTYYWSAFRRLHCQEISECIFLDRSCTCDPKEKIAEWVKEMGHLFCTRYTQHTEDHPGKHMDFACKRLQLGESLYYKLLENILVEERKKKPDLDLTVFISAGVLGVLALICMISFYISCLL
jgi:hypothetical protein